MKGEIINIGDELVSGRVCDLNSFFLSGRISSFGFEIKAISSVGDDEDRIIEVLERAVSRSDFVLVSGGLGPTEDDLTAKVAAKFSKLPLVLNEDFLTLIKRSLNERGIPWFESYKKLAYIPQGAKLVDPTEACGFYLEQKSVPIFFLPGVPAEVRSLSENKVFPLLLKREGEKVVIRQRILKLFGPQEAQIGEKLEGLGANENGVMIGFYPNFPENHVTITVRSDTEDQAVQILNRLETEVDRRLGFWIVAKDGDTIEDGVGRMLTEKGLSVAVAESCTGGLISRRLTSISGSSSYFDRGLVTYSNQAKVELLGVPADTIASHGAVSEETALSMARGVREKSRVDIGLSTTGIAGPTGGSDLKPVGTVYIGLAAANGARAKRYQFSGSREQITMLTAETALSWLNRYLKDDSFILRH